MVRSVFQNLSFGSRLQDVPRERAEPRLLPTSAPIEFRRPANANPGTLSASREQAPKSAVAPVLSLVERHPVRPSESIPGSARSMVIAGCVAFAIAGIASAGFLWLRTPPGEPASPAAHGSPEAAQTDYAPALASPAAATHAAAAIPGPAPLPRAVNSITAPKPPIDLPQTASRTAMDDRALAATPHEKTVSPARTPTAITTQQHHAIITAEAAPDHRVMAPTPAIHRPSRLRTEARYAHSRLAHDVRSSQSETSALRPPVNEAARSSRTGDSSAVQPPDQSAAFDQLLTNLTGSAKPAAAAANQSSTPPAAGSATGFDQLLAHLTGLPKPADPSSGQTLTPPAAGSPDPFAARAPEGNLRSVKTAGGAGD
jgi:hypothetical protein